MAARMDGYAALQIRPGLRAEWAAMASHWRGLAREADRQDRVCARAS